MTVADIIKKAMLAGLGAQEKAKEFVDDLVKTGELSKGYHRSPGVGPSEDSRKELIRRSKMHWYTLWNIRRATIWKNWRRRSRTQ
jgi:hypothetical protein